MKTMKKYNNGGKKPLSKKEYESIMDRLKAYIPQMGANAESFPSDTYRPYQEMTPREKFLQKERTFDPHGYYVGQIEESNLPRLVRGVDQVVTGMDYRGERGNRRREEMLGNGRNLVAEHLKMLEGDHDPREYGYSRSGLRQQIESQYDTPHEGPLSRKRDEILNEFDKETMRLMLEENRRRLNRGAEGGMKYRLLKK